MQRLLGPWILASTVLSLASCGDGEAGAPQTPAAPTTSASIAAGGAHTCELTTSGSAFCWGRNENGQLGAVPTSTCETDGGPMPCSMVPVAVRGGLAFTQLAGGDAHTCGLTTIAGGFIGHTCGLTASGKAYCWGENERGQVGDGSTIDRFVPSAVAGDLSFNSLDAGIRHTCARATTGAVYCWGSNGAGQLGNNSTSPRDVPTEVSGLP